MHVPTQICTFEGMCYYKRLTAFFSNLIMMVTVSVYLLLPLFITVRMYVPPIKYKVSRILYGWLRFYPNTKIQYTNEGNT